MFIKTRQWLGLDPKPKTEIATPKDKKESTNRYLDWAKKVISRTRQDIASWRSALSLIDADPSRTYRLQQLYSEIMNDALLSSQVNNRKKQALSSAFVLKSKSDTIDQEQSDLLKNSKVYRELINAVLDSIYFGYTLTELSYENQELNLTVLPRTNCVPSEGKFYFDYTEDKATAYRNLKEFGTWILEFDSQDLGLLNKAIPHVLFKRFAQSCWSELCEIYGIPPRVLKTNTQDRTLLNRGQKMLEDMGASAWFIIDSTEEFSFAQGVSTNGDVYSSLIQLCNNELSLLISGAVIGQDTRNGSNSKEQASQELLWQLVQDDMRLIENYFNTRIIPALVKIGFLKGELHFEFEPQEDLGQLWNITKEALPYYTINPEWVKEKFNIDVTGERSSSKEALPPQNLNASIDFFS